MAKARGKAREIVLAVTEIEKLVGQASAYIDTAEQYKIRALLEAALGKCREVRNGFDPM